MSKKPVITTEVQVLLKLLRLALGTEPRRYFGDPVEPFPTNINWKEVIRLSYEHKVSALAVDGLKSSGYDIYKDLTEQQIQKLKPIVDRWFDDVIKAEQSYTYYIEVLNTLCQILKANGLAPIILKGYGLSLNYPIPSHRGCGDIDIFIIDEYGKSAPDKGDEILRKIAKEHTFDGIAAHHTHFEFKGITVENHHELSDPTRGTNQEKEYFYTLKNMVSKECKLLSGIEYALEPSLEFNLLYQTQHIFNHFADGHINLRLLCDYYTFLRQYRENINWYIVNTIVRKAELKDFIDGIEGLIVHYLNTSQNVFSPYYTRNIKMENLLEYDFHKYNINKHIGIRNFGKYYRDRWHYRYFNNKSWIELTLRQCAEHIKIQTNILCKIF